MTQQQRRISWQIMAMRGFAALTMLVAVFAFPNKTDAGWLSERRTELTETIGELGETMAERFEPESARCSRHCQRARNQGDLNCECCVSGFENKEECHETVEWGYDECMDDCGFSVFD